MKIAFLRSGRRISAFFRSCGWVSRGGLVVIIALSVLGMPNSNSAAQNGEIKPTEPQSVDSVIRSLADGSGGLATQRLFQDLAVRKVEALPIIKGMLRTGNLWEKFYLTKFLQYCPWPEVYAELLALAEDTNGHWLTRQGALYVLGEIGDIKAGPEILSILSESNCPQGVQLVAISTLARIGYRAASSAIIPFVEHENIHMRLFATRALASFGKSVDKQFLLSSLENQNYVIRRDACGALAAVAGDDIEPILKSIAERDGNELVRSAAQIGLLERQGRKRPSQERLALFADSLGSAERRTATWIIRTLAKKCGPEGRNLIRSLSRREGRIGERSRAFLIAEEGVVPSSSQPEEASVQGGVQILHASSPTHQTLMEYSLSKAAALTTPPSFTATQQTRLLEGARDEDIPADRTANHGYNPLHYLSTPSPAAWLWNDGTPLLGTPAHDEALTRWSSTASAFAGGQLDYGDEVGAWHFLGRVSHLLQDVSSPLHALGQPHTGVTEPTCQFEGYWAGADSTLRSILNSIGGPLRSSASLPSEATARLDAFTQERLQYRYNYSCPYKNNDDVRGYLELLAWITYFRTTFWGEISFGSSGASGLASSAQTTGTSFSDGYVAAKANALYSMFPGDIWWIADWDDSYYSIGDRLGYIFIFMSWSDIDDWSSCGRNWAGDQQDSSIRIGGSDDDDRGIRITGRFWFDTRELGKDTSGSYNRKCYPYNYPNGDNMADDLHLYFGKYGYPLTVRYNAGLLGLANRRVTVNTSSGTASFTLGRPDNNNNGPSFSAGTAGSNFYFVAKSPVSLQAPAANSNGWPFSYWLRNGSNSTGSASIVINQNADWIPDTGDTWTAVYTQPPPSAPTASAATSVTSSGFQANWGSVVGATGYRLDVSTNGTFASFVSGYNDLNVGNTTYRAVSGLNPGTIYYYRVRAFSAGGASGNSNTISTTTSLVAPVVSGATNVTSSGFTSNWGSVIGATGYRLDVSTTSNFSTFVVGYNDLDVGNVLTRVVSGLGAGTLYYYRLRAYNAVITSGNSSWTSTWTCPSPPTASAATSVTSMSFQANWGSVGGATGYRLDVATDSAFTNFVSGYSDLSVVVTTRAVSGLNPGTIYYYRARATNTGGASGNSNTIMTTTDFIAPLIDAATNMTSSSFQANWESVAGATGYRLDVSTSSIFSTFVPGYNNLDVGNVILRSVSGLSAGTLYYYRLRAYNAVITSGNSSWTSTWTCPSPPTASAATSVTSTSFQANWGSVGGATGYRLDVSTDSSFASLVSGYNDLGVTVTYRVVSGLNAGTVYYYRVRATDSGGASGNSNTITTTTSFIAPTVSAATNVTSSGFQANWESVAGATGYRLDVSTSSAFSSYVPGYNDLDVGNVVLRSVSGLSAGTLYYYRLRAYNAVITSGNSSWTSTWTCPSPPTASAATSVTSTSFQANWGSVGGATGYRLDVATDSAFTNFVSGYSDLGVGNYTFKLVSGLNPGTVYYYRARATNTGGASGNSNTITITTDFIAPLIDAGTNMTSSSFQANWESVSDAAGYRLDVSTSSIFSTFVPGYNDLDVGNVIFRIVTGLSAGTRYYYRVRAYNAVITSGNSISTSTWTCPSPPAASAATSVTSSSFLANWGSVGGATGYRLDVAMDVSFMSLVSGYSDLNVGNYTFKLVSGLNVGTVYYYRARAYNTGGDSDSSNTITISTNFVAPTANAATNVMSTGFNANWTAIGGATGYRLDVSVSSLFSTFVSGYNDMDVGNVVSRAVSGLNAGTTYYYRVRAYNPITASGNSNTITVATAEHIPAVQRNALIALYNSTNGDGWTDNSGWKLLPLDADGFAMPGTEGNWHGITADAAVREINLFQNNLSGTIPPGLGTLSGLLRINLSGNNLTGILPTELGNLPNLAWLDLSANALTGSIPTSLGNLISLTDMNLSGNQLSGSIPSEIGNLTQMSFYLNLSHNQLTGSIPATLGNLVNLDDLHLENNQLSGPIPLELGNMRGLYWLTLQNNHLSGQISPSLGNLSVEIGLDLSGNALTGPIPAELGNLRFLRGSLRLNGNALRGPIPAALASLMFINEIDLGYNALTTDDPGLITFLEGKDPDWASTQTTMPAQISASAVGGTTVLVTWTPILYQSGSGRYVVSANTTAGGPYTFAGQTENKNAPSLIISGLTPGTPYYFVVKSQTDAHALNGNVVESDNSTEATAATFAQLSVQGTILQDGAPVAGVVLSGMVGSPVTNSSGAYQGTVNVGWSGLVTPSLSGYMFTPANRTYAGILQDQWSQDFEADNQTSFLSLTSPNGGENWTAGTTHDITWTQTGLTGTVTIDLYKSGVYYKTLGTAQATSGTFTWSIAPTETPGTNYRALVWQGSVSDSSAADFIILPARKDDLLGTWDGQGVYYRNSDTGAWVQMASPATMLTSGDLDGDGIDDLIGIWPSQGGVWVKYSTSGNWAYIASTAQYICTGDMNGDGRVDLLGTWSGQGVYYRDSMTEVWVLMASPATMITSGDLDGDGTDDLIGIWPSQGGVWVKYSSTGGWAYIGSDAQYISSGDMNGDGREELLGNWIGQGVYYRHSITGSWTLMASEATMITSGDLDGDGTDDLIGIWPSQGGVWVKRSSNGGWQLLSSTAQYIATGKMRPAASPAPEAVDALESPMGGAATGPDAADKRTDESASGPGGWRFVWLQEKNLIPQEAPSARLTRIPGPGEPLFNPQRQANLFPGSSNDGRTIDKRKEKIRARAERRVN